MPENADNKKSKTTEETTEIQELPKPINDGKEVHTTKTTKTLVAPKGQTARAKLDPLVECFFDLEISYNGKQIAQAYFHSLTGGEMSIALIEHNVVYQSGNSTTLYIPGPTSFEPITLYQGVTSDITFWNWWTDVTKGKKVRRNATIKAFGGYTREKVQGEQTDPPPQMAQWSLENVWPLSISGFSFDLDSDQAFIAQITLVAESIERKS
ncbi:MAG: hypothetical protein D6768_03035 [Chloroflexi bacterium]|nr:MAG: hypothetical protein D6768_03035 [Chloroflexota bacterium]